MDSAGYPIWSSRVRSSGIHHTPNFILEMCSNPIIFVQASHQGQKMSIFNEKIGGRVVITGTHTAADGTTNINIGYPPGHGHLHSPEHTRNDVPALSVD